MNLAAWLAPLWADTVAFLEAHWHTIFMSPIGLVSWFFVFYSLINFVYIKHRKLSDTQWKFVDYLWLAAAAIGIASAVNAVKAYDYQQIHQSALRFEANEASVLQKSLLVMSLSPQCSSTGELGAEQRRALHQVCGLYEHSLTRAVDGRPSFPSSTELEKVREILAPTLDTADKLKLDRISRSALRYEVRVSDTEDAVANMTRDISDLVFMAISPLLLVLALALRAVKVTAEIQSKCPGALLLSTSTSASNPSPSPSPSPSPAPTPISASASAPVPPPIPALPSNASISGAYAGRQVASESGPVAHNPSENAEKPPIT